MDVVSPNTVKNIQAVAVLAGAVAAYIFVPERILMPVAAGVLAIAVGGVVALRAYMGRVRAAGQADAETEVRLTLLTEVGMGLGILGLVAFIILLVEFSD